MKKGGLAALAFILFTGFITNGQKTISEGTIVYDISIQPKGQAGKAASGLTGATTTICLKGGLTRTDMTSTFGTETTIYNAKLGTAVILKEYSGQKLMITLTKENWIARNKKFDGVTFVNTAEAKVIQNYNCKKAIAKLNDGSTITVFYTPDLSAINKDYSQEFRNLPGFPVEYEFETAKGVFKYHLSNIDLTPLPSSKFDFPKAGYRVMTYDENKKGKAED